MLPLRSCVHVAPPSVVFMNPPLVAAKIVLASVGCASMSATAVHAALAELLAGTVLVSCTKFTPSVDLYTPRPAKLGVVF